MDGSVYAHNSHGQPFDNFGFGDSEAVEHTRKKVKLDAGKANYHIDDCITTTSSSESYKEEILQHVPEPAWNGHLMPYSSRPTIFRSIPLGFTKDDNGYLLHSRLPNVDLQMKGNIIVESQPQHSDAPSPTKTS
ncbi:hypothetical protein AXF42_Ash005674 [Apostasia shenzhenica]|uniref:Uncharacterized protein n=1 Tax=Apostasia shenzhenica TaxID=1088818 RepID=A0A2I0BC34_9ASPA|nr:hypothetical protein AXF42_Ash005674 [Apostasia shenzhenica]